VDGERAAQDLEAGEGGAEAGAGRFVVCFDDESVREPEPLRAEEGALRSGIGELAVGVVDVDERKVRPNDVKVGVEMDCAEEVGFGGVVPDRVDTEEEWEVGVGNIPDDHVEDLEGEAVWEEGRAAHG
jgi:hypothetical protein